MRQFIFANAFGTKAAGNVILETVGEVKNFVLVRDADKGGNILYPFYPKEFSYSKAEYTPAKTFNATFTIGDVTPKLDYTILISKKGMRFNQRANWTATTHSKDGDTATTIAKRLADYVNANSANLGLKATTNAGTITFTGVAAGADFALNGADELLGVKPTITQKGVEAFLDAKMIKDMFAKCAADAGFEYTYDDFDGLYPGLDFNPIAGADVADTGFTVFTLRFTEPRFTGTRDEAVYQIIQIALPTGEESIATLETELKKY